MKIIAAIEPVPLGRARINTSTHGRYLPPRSKQFKEELSAIALREMKNEEPIKGLIKVTLKFSKRGTVGSRRYGDLDNHVKAVMDALNGVVWVDDAQVVEMHAFKRNGDPLIEIEISDEV